MHVKNEEVSRMTFGLIVRTSLPIRHFITFMINIDDQHILPVIILNKLN